MADKSSQREAIILGKKTKYPDFRDGPCLTNCARIRGFRDLNKSGDDDDDDKQGYYAGGSEKSGVQIQDPRKKDSSNKMIEEVFEKAKQVQGAQRVEDMEKEKFGGQGFKLGQPSTGSTAVPGQKKSLKVITFWKNGFTINDGALRSYTDPQNKEFLADIQEGFVPQELENEAQGQQIHTELVDKKQENYKEPEKPKIVAFSGQGQTLGGTSTSPATATAVPASALPQNFAADESKPTTTIRVRLADGTTLTAKFNHDHTVLHIRAFIQASKPQSRDYDLVSPVPPPKVLDNNQTLKEAGLINAAITQRLK